MKQVDPIPARRAKRPHGDSDPGEPDPGDTPTIVITIVSYRECTVTKDPQVRIKDSVNFEVDDPDNLMSHISVSIDEENRPLLIDEETGELSDTFYLSSHTPHRSFTISEDHSSEDLQKPRYFGVSAHLRDYADPIPGEREADDDDDSGGNSANNSYRRPRMIVVTAE